MIPRRTQSNSRSSPDIAFSHASIVRDVQDCCDGLTGASLGPISKDLKASDPRAGWLAAGSWLARMLLDWPARMLLGLLEQAWVPYLKT